MVVIYNICVPSFGTLKKMHAQRTHISHNMYGINWSVRNTCVIIFVAKQMANRHMEPTALFIMSHPIAPIAGSHFLLVVACSQFSNL